MNPISVCTLAHGRADHLANLVRGLAASHWPVDELIISVLQDEVYDLPSAPFPIRQLRLSETKLCLARARNLAALAATGSLLVFLDVDCIPHPSLLSDYAAASRVHGGVLMGEVGYLPKGATDTGIDIASFETLAVRHVDRPGPPAGFSQICRDYRSFWSLNFAMSAADFARSGGFDEGYSGYGGEDTDFGRVCTHAGLDMWWVKGAKAFHQYHSHHMPPVHHIDSVIANAEYFRGKWGEPTMQHWLRAFRLMGLAEPGPNGWQRIRDVRTDDLDLTRQQADQPYASSSAVLTLLESMERSRT